MTRGAALWAVAAVAIAVVAFIAGRGLRDDSTVADAFDLESLPYSRADLPAAYTHGGFTGFGEVGLEGRTTISGRVVSVGANGITLQTVGGEQSVTLSGGRSLRRFQPADRAALRPGVTVVVLLEPGSDQARSVLVLRD